jgi:hypothetical protein
MNDKPFGVRRNNRKDPFNLKEMKNEREDYTFYVRENGR